jgi:formylglycine-generating enzyme required for sulfatase activity
MKEQEARLDGDGAIAQDGSVAAGRQGIIIQGSANTVQVSYQDDEVVIPSSEAITAHREALAQRLTQETQSRWGGISLYIQEESAMLPIEASPYEQGRLGKRENLLQTLHQAERLMVLGEPGAGKTVALERFAWDVCARGAETIPVLVRLFHYAGSSLGGWVRAVLQQTGHLRLNDERALAAFLHEGAARCVFLFDGLNEVPPAYRDSLVDELVRWMAAFPRHPLILTSRVQDELWRRLRTAVSQTMVIQEIGDDQAWEYLKAHLHERGTALYSRLDDRLRALARRPLLLWLIKEAGAAGEMVPGNRGELYARFVSRMLRRDTDRRLDAEIPERLKMQALADLAYALGQEQRLICSRTEAVSVVARRLGEERARSVVDSCARHGLLMGQETLWFAPHQTVQEHFAALALREQLRLENEQSRLHQMWQTAQRSLTGRVTGVAALAADDWWAETFVQLAGLVDEADALAEAVARVNPWLAWWCVQEGRNVGPETRSFVEARSVDQLKADRVSERRRAVAALAELRNERVVKPLFWAAGDADEEVARIALQTLGEMGDAARVPVVRALYGGNRHGREIALRYLRTQPHSSLWLQAAERCWYEMRTADRQQAVITLAQMRHPRAVECLLRAVSDRSEKVATLALRALSVMGKPARAMMSPALQQPDCWPGILRYVITHPSAELSMQIPMYMWEQEIGLPMIWIPAGPFLMGSDKERDPVVPPEEVPQHEVTLPHYWISNTPVRVKDFQTFVRESGYPWKALNEPQGGEDHPVVHVTWYDALAYCEWLRKKTALPVALPSEAEWEKAARGPDGLNYPWGNVVPSGRRCNFNNHVETTTPVNAYTPEGDSPYGCADMAGNVGEWTRSLWGSDQRGPDFPYPYAPEDGRENLNAPEMAQRIVRGGTFLSSSRGVRCAFRDYRYPNSRLWLFGFRIAISPAFKGRRAESEEQGHKAFPDMVRIWEVVKKQQLGGSK